MPHWAKLHEQQPLYSSISVLGTYFCVTVLPSHRRTDNILSPFFKTGNDVNTALCTTSYLWSLFFLQSNTSQKCIISSTLSKPKHFHFIAIIIVEPIYFKHKQQSQKKHPNTTQWPCNTIRNSTSYCTEQNFRQTHKIHVPHWLQDGGQYTIQTYGAWTFGTYTFSWKKWWHNECGLIVCSWTTSHKQPQK